MIKELQNKELYKLNFKVNKSIFFPVYTFDMCLSSNFMKKVFEVDFKATFNHEKDKVVNLYFEKDRWEELAKKLVNNLKNKGYFSKIKGFITKYNQKFEAFIEQLDSPEKINFEGSLKLYEEYINLLRDFRVFAIIPNIISWGNNVMVDEYKKELSRKLSNEEFSIMTSSEELTESTLAEKELLELISKNKLDDKSLKKWVEKYGYIYYYYTGPLPTIHDVRKMVEDMKNNYSNISERIKEIDNYSKTIKEQKEKVKDLKEKDYYLLNVIAYFNYYKQVRKELMQKSYVSMDKVFKVLSSKLNKEIDDLKFLTLDETKQFRERKEELSRLIDNRKKELLYVNTSAGISVINDKNEINDILKNIKVSIPAQKMLVAYSSEKPVVGKIVVINSKEDMKKVEQVNEPFILASHSTNPDLLPAMVKSTGIVTRVGGMTSHAAIVSRELKKPCIIGYGELFEHFKEGDIIELNTKECQIRKMRK